MSRTTGARRPLFAAVRSVIVPGWGHVHIGRRRAGWTMATISVVAASLAIGTVVMAGPTEIIARLTEPGVLTAVLVVNAALGVLRIGPALHAFWAAGGRSALISVVIVTVVAAPHVAVGYLGTETRRTLETVFAAPTTTSTTTTVSTTTLPPTTIPPASAPDDSRPATTTTSTTAPPPSTTTTTIALDAPEERLNVLLLGGDAGPGRSGLRTDSVLVTSVAVETGESVIFSLPRNWGGLELADGSRVPGRILNEVYEWGRLRPDRFPGPDPGAGALVEVAEVLTGLDIDYFALVDLTGFADVVDAVGGVTIEVPRSVYGPRYDPGTGRYTMIRIPRGTQTLDGGAALAYVREQYQSSDHDRMARQRCVVAALASGADAFTLLRGLPGVLDAIETHVVTDVPLDEVAAMVRIAGRVTEDDIHLIGFDNAWRRGWTAEGFAIPDPARIQATVQAAIEDPAAAASTGLAEAGEECG